MAPLKELRGFCSAALAVTGITGAHNGQVVQDSSSGHARRTCLKPELPSSEMASLLRGIIDHLTTWKPAVPPEEDLGIVLRMLTIILNRREHPQQSFLISADQHQAQHCRGQGFQICPSALEPSGLRPLPSSNRALPALGPGGTVTLLTGRQEQKKNPYAVSLMHYLWKGAAKTQHAPSDPAAVQKRPGCRKCCSPSPPLT